MRQEEPGAPRPKYLTRGGPPEEAELVVTMTRGDLRELVAEVLRAEQRKSALLVDKQELSRLLRVSAGHIDVLRKRGLPAVTIGSSVRFEPSAVIEWLKRSGDRAA